MAELKLYEGTEPLVVSAATIFHIVKAIIAANREAEYLAAVQKFDQSIEVQPDLINFVKTFLHNETAHDGDAAISLVVSSPSGSTSCFPKRARQ